MTLITPIEDIHAALLCDLAAARLRGDRERMRELIVRLQGMGYRAPLQAAEQIARTAIDAEREARS